MKKMKRFSPCFVGGGKAEMRAMRYSASHDGFAIYLSRLLRPIWSQPLLEKKAKREEKNGGDEAKIQIAMYVEISILYKSI
jgi:hypothetical protein